MKRLPYDPERLCPKCRNTTVTTSWCKGSQWRLVSTWCSDGEHFHRYCQRCHFEWEEDVTRDLPEEPPVGSITHPISLDRTPVTTVTDAKGPEWAHVEAPLTPYGEALAKAQAENIVAPRKDVTVLEGRICLGKDGTEIDGQGLYRLFTIGQRVRLTVEKLD